MKTIVFFGAEPTDEVFSSDPAIFGEEIIWNITRIQRDADAGKFGPPEEAILANLGHMTDAHRANMDEAKIVAFIKAHAAGSDILSKPVLAVTTMKGIQATRLIVDGNQRVTARQRLGLKSFLRYVVPLSLETTYRITVEHRD